MTAPNRRMAEHHRNPTDWKTMSSDDTDSSGIDSLTCDMKNFADDGKADLKFSAATLDKYLNILGTYRDALKSEKGKLDGLTAMDNVGTLDSAIQTKNNLQDDITGPDGLQASLTKYLTYLDDFEQAMRAASKRLLDADAG
jgi:hypothetical protein